MAKIKDDDISALRESADIVEIVSGYTHLKRAGGHSFKGLCPFHSEKTPSFTVNSERGLWHCFGCGEGGDIYSFVERVESMDFPDAVEWLARKLNFPLRYEEARPGEAQAHGLKLRLRAANAAAAQFFHDRLLNGPDAAEARAYLEGRGISPDTARRWLLGYAPGRDLLTRHLLAAGFTQKEIEQADLARRSERGTGLYDVFRRRIIFPTWDRNDEVVGFGARALGDEQPKYLNSSETPVFAKSRVMYGLNKAKSAIARGAPAIVVEGYTDVIAVHEAGIPQAVATNGVALGESHFELLKKYTDRVVLMFDADTAGRGATERAFGLHYRIGLEVLVAPLPAGSDPADVVAREGGDGIRRAIEGARPLVEFKLEQTIAGAPLDSPEARAKASRAAAEVLAWLPDPIARSEYVFLAAHRIGVDSDALHRALGELRSPSTQPAGTAERDRDRRLPGHVKVEREALQLLLTTSPTSTAWASELDEEHFSSATRRELFRALIKRLGDATSATSDIVQELSPDAAALFTELAVTEGEVDGVGSDEDVREVFVRLKLFRLEREIKQRRDVLHGINPQVDPARHDALFTELVGLEAARRDLLSQLQGAA